jgi:hypothetical protein
MDHAHHAITDMMAHIVANLVMLAVQEINAMKMGHVPLVTMAIPV